MFGIDVIGMITQYMGWVADWIVSNWWIVILGTIGLFLFVFKIR